MTPSRFRECLAAIGWTQDRGAAAFFGCSARTVRRWASGASPVPSEGAALLERLAAWIEENRPAREPGND